MSKFPSLRPRVACLSAVLAAWTLFAAAAALASPEELAQRYPKGSFSSVEQADQALQQVQQERAAVEAEFADAQYACYSKFFSTPCVDHAKERRRNALHALREVEVDAQAYKRREKVAERDSALQQQAEKDAAEAPDRAAREKENEEKAAQRAADRAARTATPAAAPGAAHGPATPKAEAAPRTGGRDRAAEHEAKLREEQRESAAGAAQRAQNVEEYRRKQEEAKERQRRVAEKVADRERKLKEKAAQGGAATPAPAEPAGR